jgi:hypothetical protein
MKHYHFFIESGHTECVNRYDTLGGGTRPVIHTLPSVIFYLHTTECE